MKIMLKNCVARGEAVFLNAGDSLYPIVLEWDNGLLVTTEQLFKSGGGPTPVNIDLRFDTATDAMNVVNVLSTTSQTPGTLIVEPGSKETSELWDVMMRLGAGRMPPLGSNEVDDDGVDLIGEWIDQGAP